MLFYPQLNTQNFLLQASFTQSHTFKQAPCLKFSHTNAKRKTQGPLSCPRKLSHTDWSSWGLNLWLLHWYITSSTSSTAKAEKQQWETTERGSNPVLAMCTLLICFYSFCIIQYLFFVFKHVLFLIISFHYICVTLLSACQSLRKPFDIHWSAWEVPQVTD